jgi:hypothetical protein
MFSVVEWSAGEQKNSKPLIIGRVMERKGTTGWVRPLEIRVPEVGYSVQTVVDHSLPILVECETLANINKSEFSAMIKAVCRKYLEATERYPWLKEIGGEK